MNKSILWKGRGDLIDIYILLGKKKLAAKVKLNLGHAIQVSFVYDCSLTEIFNISRDSNQFPSDWKAARVIPLFRKGQQSVLDTYKPISILPVVTKIMERFL